MNASAAKRRKSILIFSIALLALIAGAAAGWITQRLNTPALPRLEVATALLDQPRPLPQFNLIDGAGDTFDKQDLQGRWSFLFFGYTHCPDVCPTTLATMNEALRAIKVSAGTPNPQVVFVSVDPQRDTPAKLKRYVDYFNPTFVGATGEPAALNKLTRALGIVHAKLPGERIGENYLVDHSASILLINPQGELAALFSAPHRAKAIAGDFERLRAYEAQS